jgi:glucokinase
MSTPHKAIGIDFGGTSIKSAVVQAGTILDRGEPIDPQQHPQSHTLVAAMVEIVGSLRAVHPEIAAIGVGMPGFVDSVRGVVHNLTNVSGWSEVPLHDQLTARTGLPAIVENDAKAMAYGEFKHGAARGFRHVICVTLGTGVGGALILDGRLYRGAQFAAGELGHTSIDYRGKLGPYGDRGGLEEYVGNHQIAERASELYRNAGRKVSLAQCQPHELAKAASRGDALALSLWETVGTEIGSALANAVWILNPDAIVIGGGIANAGELILGPIRRTIRARTLPLIHENLQILPATLGNDAGIIGNAELALEAAATVV